MSSPEKDFPESEMSSDPTGFSSAPRHYAQQERAPDPRWLREGFVPYQRHPAPPMQDPPFTMEGEPTVMPGFEAPVDQDITRATANQQVLAAPLGSYDRLELEPWPPLSREQVVELHEALRDFATDMASARKPMSDEDQANTIWSAAVELHSTLRRLGIGTPLWSKRWSEEDLQQAVDAAQKDMAERVGLPQHLLRGVPHPTATELAILESLGREPVKHNCGTCQHYHQPSEMGCGVTETSPGARMWRMNAAGATTSGVQLLERLEQRGDGCPGWEQKP